LGIYLERHHEALSDARGCQGIFFKIVERFGYNEGFVSSYYKPRKPVKSSCEHVGLSSTTDEVQIRERTFCLTGDFKYGEKTDVELFIMARGGSISPQVNKQVDYLLVGDLGSPKWAYGAYGTKVKKANALRSAGVSIDIVLEKDFWQLEGR
jgi:NAD-dependent DNA ligase